MRARYDGIYRDLRDRILEEEYPFQSFLPSESELVKTYDCSHNTVRRALAMLAEEGFVTPIHGKGVRVIYRPQRKAMFQFGGVESFKETARANKLDVHTRVLTFEEVVANDELADITGFNPGTPLWHIERVRDIDGHPLIVDINYFLRDSMPELTREIAEGSIYEYLENELGVVIAVSKRTMVVETATRRDREILDMDKFDSLVVVSGQMFAQDGALLEFTSSRHRQDYFAFSFTARRAKQ